MKATFRMGLLGALIALVLPLGGGCADPVEGTGNKQSTSKTDGTSTPDEETDGETPSGGTGDGTETPGTGVDANTQYVPEQNTAKAQAIAARMWTVMTAAPCWYMQNSTNNYSFFGYNEYRYAGYETTSGQITVLSTGKFGPYDTGEIIISRSQYWVAVVDAKTIAISFIHDNGKYVLNYFTAAAPGQVCV